MKSLADSGAREAIRSDLDTTLIVEAAAGTGKTTELVQRIIALLRARQDDPRETWSRSPSPRRRRAR